MRAMAALGTGGAPPKTTVAASRKAPRRCCSRIRSARASRAVSHIMATSINTMHECMSFYPALCGLGAASRSRLRRLFPTEACRSFCSREASASEWVCALSLSLSLANESILTTRERARACARCSHSQAVPFSGQGRRRDRSLLAPPVCKPSLRPGDHCRMRARLSKAVRGRPLQSRVCASAALCPSRSSLPTPRAKVRVCLNSLTDCGYTGGAQEKNARIASTMASSKCLRTRSSSQCTTERALWLRERRLTQSLRMRSRSARLLWASRAKRR